MLVLNHGMVQLADPQTYTKTQVRIELFFRFEHLHGVLAKTHKHVASVVTTYSEDILYVVFSVEKHVLSALI